MSFPIICHFITHLTALLAVQAAIKRSNLVVLRRNLRTDDVGTAASAPIYLKATLVCRCLHNPAGKRTENGIFINVRFFARIRSRA